MLRIRLVSQRICRGKLIVLERDDCDCGEMIFYLPRGCYEIHGLFLAKINVISEHPGVQELPHVLALVISWRKLNESEDGEITIIDKGEKETACLRFCSKNTSSSNYVIT